MKPTHEENVRRQDALYHFLLKREPVASVDGYLHCEQCGNVIAARGRLTDVQVARTALDEFGEQLCWPCGQRRFDERTAAG